MRWLCSIFGARRGSAGLILLCVLIGLASSALAQPSPGAGEESATASGEMPSAGSASPLAPDSSGSSRSADRGREARLNRALEDYAHALTESRRDARLAGFAQAEQGFASLAADGVETAALWTNLGNAALQAQHPGQAVLAYHRALRLEPDATAARQNLIHVRSRLPSWVPRPDSSEGTQALLFYRQIGAGMRSQVAAICFAAMAVCVALAVRRREGAWRGMAILMGLAWAISVASLVYDNVSGEDNLAVLVADEVLARSADSSLAPLALPDALPAGVEVDLLEARAEWTRVRLANGRDVWVRSSTVERVGG